LGNQPSEIKFAALETKRTEGTEKTNPHTLNHLNVKAAETQTANFRAITIKPHT